MPHTSSPPGMRVFIMIWVGQFISLLGTGITRFAITLWAWEVTGQASALSFAAFFGVLPLMLMSPIAGALVDRWNRKLVIMLSDLGAAGATLLLFVLITSGNLEIWHIYLAAFIAGIFESFQFPAFSAAITTIVDKKQYARAGAMMGIAETTSGIFAPILGTAFYATIRLDGIFLIDITTCLIAVLLIALSRIPQPAIADSETDDSKGNLFYEAIYGFKYIWKRSSLFGLQMVFFFCNLLFGLYAILLSAMILARTDNNQLVLRDVTTLMAVGGVASGLLISLWGGPKRRIHGVLIGWGLTGIVPVMAFGITQTPVAWAIVGFIGTFILTVVNPSNQAIWQSKVPTHIQGRVFSARRMIAQVAGPFAMLVAGPLADYIFEPAMKSDSFLSQTFGGWVGTGAGAGMGLMFVFTGALIVLTTIIAYLIPAIRNVEDIIPDHQNI